jgi:hypothetical protein
MSDREEAGWSRAAQDEAEGNPPSRPEREQTQAVRYATLTPWPHLMLLGAIIGAAIGGIVGYTSYPVDPNAIDSHGIEAFAGAFWGFVLGAFAGLVVALSMAGRNARRNDRQSSSNSRSAQSGQ